MKGTVKTYHSITQTEVDGVTVTITTGEEAEDRMNDLMLAIQLTQARLGDQGRTDDEGNHLSFAEWNDWSKRAKIAVAIKHAQHRELAQWLRMRKMATPLATEDGKLHSSRDVMHAAARVLYLASSGQPIDRDFAYALSSKLQAVVTLREHFGPGF